MLAYSHTVCHLHVRNGIRVIRDGEQFLVKLQNTYKKYIPTLICTKIALLDCPVFIDAGQKMYTFCSYVQGFPST